MTNYFLNSKQQPNFLKISTKSYNLLQERNYKRMTIQKELTAVQKKLTAIKLKVDNLIEAVEKSETKLRKKVNGQ